MKTRQKGHSRAHAQQFRNRYSHDDRSVRHPALPLSRSRRNRAAVTMPLDHSHAYPPGTAKRMGSAIISTSSSFKPCRAGGTADPAPPLTPLARYSSLTAAPSIWPRRHLLGAYSPGALENIIGQPWGLRRTQQRRTWQQRHSKIPPLSKMVSATFKCTVTSQAQCLVSHAPSVSVASAAKFSKKVMLPPHARRSWPAHILRQCRALGIRHQERHRAALGGEPLQGAARQRRPSIHRIL